MWMWNCAICHYSTSRGILAIQEHLHEEHQIPVAVHRHLTAEKTTTGNRYWAPNDQLLYETIRHNQRSERNHEYYRDRAMARMAG